MADLKISQLPAATTPLAGTEVLPIVQSGSTVQVSVNNLTVGKAVTATSFTDDAGKLRAIPQSGAAKTTSYTLATTDVGEFIEVGASGAIVIPNAVFSAGDAVVIFNNTASNVTITCTITTAYKAGTDADQATVTLTTRGVCNILFISGTVCVITGNLS
jgi:hypothetical protein